MGRADDTRHLGFPEDPDETSALIRRAVLLGEFELAVEICLGAGRLSDALILGVCGGTELWALTQTAYFSHPSNVGNSYLPLVKFIMANDLGKLVERADPARWHETLAVICTYASPEEFAVLCAKLGQR